MGKPRTAAVSSYEASEKKWRTESDLRTLQEAEAIERDPARMKAAQDLAKQKLVELAAVVGDSDAPGKK